MKENYSILLMGNIYDNHMIRFVKNLKKENPKAQIDFFAVRQKGKVLDSDYLDCFRECYIVDFTKFFAKVPLLRTIEIINNWKVKFGSFAKNRHYDIINLHYPTYTANYILNDLKKIANKMVLTPWGSDVYRISDRKRRIVKNVYDRADFVTGHGDRFTKDFMRIFNIPQSKIASADIGSDSIDKIIELKSEVSIVEAKRQIGVEDSYVITCGYNAHTEQQHLKMIDAIGSIKDKLPSNLVLFFPLTYPKNPNYCIKIKQLVDAYGFKSVFFEEYLDLNALFCLQQATDLFIHIQTTDANSVSIKEYLLLNKNIINGSWLIYDELEINNVIPYYLVSNLEELPHVILVASQKGPNHISQQLVSQIEKSGWRNGIVEWNNLFKSLA